MMSEKLCLQWNDFKENAVNTLQSLKDDEDFTDMTLVCEDGKQVEAHKVILANSSPFLQNILRRNKHIHPLIYMRGVKSDDLRAIVDFLYCGEANVYQENLDSFLAIAEELQLKGLVGKSDKDEVVPDDTFRTEKVKPFHKKEASAMKPIHLESQSHLKGEQMANSALDDLGGELALGEVALGGGEVALGEVAPGEVALGEVALGGGEVALTSHFPSGDLQELDQKCTSMMEKTSGKNAHGQPLYRCKECGKEKIIGNIKSHIESNHLECFSIPCNFCGKTFRSRKSLAKHTRINHKDCKDNIPHFSSSIF